MKYLIGIENITFWIRLAWLKYFSLLILIPTPVKGFMECGIDTNKKCIDDK